MSHHALRHTENPHATSNPNEGDDEKNDVRPLRKGRLRRFGSHISEGNHEYFETMPSFEQLLSHIMSLNVLLVPLFLCGGLCLRFFHLPQILIDLG